MTKRRFDRNRRLWGALLLVAGGCMLLGCTGCLPAVGQDRFKVNTTSSGLEGGAAFGELDPFGPASTAPATIAFPPRAITKAPVARAAAAKPEGAKYRGLLMKIRVDEDQSTYGEFYDYGYWSGTSWRGHGDLPPGYWVYVAPYWHIYGEANSAPTALSPSPQRQVDLRRIAPVLARMRELEQQVGSLRKELEQLVEPSPPPPPPSPVRSKRSGGPEQATGPPDTPRAGDISTAWASQTADGQDEWLRLHYAKQA
jgi:hypothetical protein